VVALAGVSVTSTPAEAREHRVLFVARLSCSISTRTAHPGDRVSAILVSPATDDAQVIIPRGSVIVGSIAMVHRVGAGLVHERASLDIVFQQWRSEDGVLHPLSARLVSVDNAREQVSADGRITGILAAGGPPGFLLGMWQRPTDELFLRTAVGIAGFTGFIGHAFDFDPVGIAGVAALRLAVVPTAEPEIWFPRGTDLILSLSTIPPGDHPSEPALEAPSPELQSWGESLPVQTSRVKEAETADITNVVFFGAHQQLVNAFAAAGWSEPEPFTRQSCMRFYRAMSAQRGYATAPMSTLLLDDKPADLEFEKSLNTVQRRHHVRIWQQSAFEGSEAWLGAATHDIGVRLTGHGFNHQTDSRIDGERDWIIDDLAFAGCVEQVQFVNRPTLASSYGDPITDGRLAVVRLQDCRGAAITDQPPHQSTGARLARRLVLEARYSVLRGNVYYWAWRGIRHVWIRKRQEEQERHSGGTELAVAGKLPPRPVR